VKILANNQMLLPRRSQPNDRAWSIRGFLIGFVIGLALSLTYGWILDPHPLPVTPAELRVDHKEAYLRLIATAYAYDHDELRAQARLATLQEPNVPAMIIRVTEMEINRGDVRDVIALVELAQAVGELSPAMAVFLTTPTATPTTTPIPTSTLTPTPPPTFTPNPTFTPLPTSTSTLTPTVELTVTTIVTIETSVTITRTVRPTRTQTPTPTPDPYAPFSIVKSEAVCDKEAPGLLRIYLHDRFGVGIPGVEIIVRWPGGEDNIFTGFKPAIDSGYADFQMDAEKIYQLELIGYETIEPIPEIRIDDQNICQDVIPSWRIVFLQES
jgi:hypothetical protein